MRSPDPSPDRQHVLLPAADRVSRGPRLTRRAFVAATTAITAGLAAGGRALTARAGHDPSRPTAKRPPPSNGLVSYEETRLAFRCHGFPLEALRHQITPLGMHYVLMHFDVPKLDHINPSQYTISIEGHVRKPFTITLDQLKKRPAVKQPTFMECAGTGRAFLHPRPIYVPWFENAIGNYEYTGTPLRPLLEQAGILEGAVEVLFTGWDEGVDLATGHAFERAMPLAEALLDGVLLAWDANGQPLLPMHGFPLRAIVPTWYGMQSVKWLRKITVLKEPFKGVENEKVYRITFSADDPGQPVTRKAVNSVIQPPGVPDLFTRHRFVQPGRVPLHGAAWSGHGPIVWVGVSTDSGKTWQDALMEKPLGPYAWTHWNFTWENATPGDYVLLSRAADAAGNVQPIEPFWNYQGMAQNGVHFVNVTVRPPGK